MLFRPDIVLRQSPEPAPDAGGDRQQSAAGLPTGSPADKRAGASGMQRERPDDSKVTGKTGAEQYHKLRADSFAREAQLTALDATVQESIARDEQVAFEGEAKRLEEFQHEMAELQQQALNSSLQQAAQVQKLGEEIGNMYPRPGRLFQDSSAAATWGAAMSLAAASFQSSRTGGPNAALGIIQQAIQQDIAAQEIEYDAKKTALGAAQTVYQELRQAYGDAQQAKNAQSAILMEAARHRLEAASRMAKTKPVDLGMGLSMSHYEMQASIASQKLIQARNEQLIKMAEKTYEIKSRGAYGTSEGRLAQMLGRLGDPTLLAALKEGPQDFETLGKAAQAGQARAAKLAAEKKQRAEQDGAKADVAVDALRVFEANGAKKPAPGGAPVEESAPDVGADDQRPIDWNRADLVDPEMREWSFEKQAAQDARDAAQAAASAARDQSEADTAAVGAAEAEVERIEGLKPPNRSGRYGAVDPREVASEKEFGKPGREADRKWNVALSEARAALDAARDAEGSSSRAREESESSLASAEQAFQQSRGVADERRAQASAQREQEQTREALAAVERDAPGIQQAMKDAVTGAGQGGPGAVPGAESEYQKDLNVVRDAIDAGGTAGQVARKSINDSLPEPAAKSRGDWTDADLRKRFYVLGLLGGAVNTRGLEKTDFGGFAIPNNALSDVGFSERGVRSAITKQDVRAAEIPVVFGVGFNKQGRPLWNQAQADALSKQLSSGLIPGARLSAGGVTKTVKVPAYKWDSNKLKYVSDGTRDQKIALPVLALSKLDLDSSADSDAYSFIPSEDAANTVPSFDGTRHVLNASLPDSERRYARETLQNVGALKRAVASSTLFAFITEGEDLVQFKRSLGDEVQIEPSQIKEGIEKLMADKSVPPYVKRELRAGGPLIREDGTVNYANKALGSIAQKSGDEVAVRLGNLSSAVGSLSHFYGFMAPQKAELQLLSESTQIKAGAPWDVFANFLVDDPSMSRARQFANDIETRYNDFLNVYTYKQSDMDEVYKAYAEHAGKGEVKTPKAVRVSADTRVR